MTNPGKPEKIFVFKNICYSKPRHPKDKHWPWKAKPNFGGVQVWHKFRGHTSGKIYHSNCLRFSYHACISSVLFATSFLFLFQMSLSLVRVKISALEQHCLGCKPKHSWCSLKTTGESRMTSNWHGPEAKAGVRDLCYINTFTVIYHRTNGNISWHS